ncbi:hypothetical protein ICL16_32705 [Iningainema sp. BLCCT55]|uniref:Uncharacterized protein n=2 Tax=Iningainema TaxID=1932705 RepID=A0A8J7CA32_9CYAN|nr:hypothetical protein [Iningainema tapete]MBD2776686.1 hypothetical protein [Iningainema tapete BLCC-T55]
MKSLLKFYFTTKQAQIFTALVLTGILSISSGLTSIESVTAAPTNPEIANAIRKENTLPRSVATAVIRDLSGKEGIPSRKLQITNYSQHTWRNGCLNLPLPDEFCTQALVSGWRVVVSDGSQNWIYHTNDNGRFLRLANSDNSKSEVTELPDSVKNAVLRVTSRRLKLPVAQLNIIQVQQRTWKNSCLEVTSSVPNFFCSQKLVSGWRVIVGAPEQALVYHTNNSGSVVKLNKRESEISENSQQSQIQPVPISSSELPPPLQSSVIFRSFSTGGFTGRTYETVLLNDGRLMQYRIGDTKTGERRVWRISTEKVRQFQQLLAQKGDRFNNLSYPAPKGAADYITYTLTSSEGSIQYNDISQSSLPKNLQLIVKAWNQISKSYQ